MTETRSAVVHSNRDSEQQLSVLKQILLQEDQAIGKAIDDPVVKAGIDRNPDDIVSETVALVRERVGPVAVFKKAMVVKRLPKTRSGKILRATMAKIADGEDFKMPATIDDPAILDEITEAVRGMGYAKG